MARINRISITLCALLFTTLPLTPMAHASKQARESSATTHITKKADKKKSTATTKKTQKTAKKAASGTLADAHKAKVQKATKVAMNKLMQQIGKPYRWGGSSPRTGFDCSGLVYYAYKDLVKIRIPRTANEMYHLRDAAPIERSELKNGDLVFFRTQGRGTADHVGVYVGNGKFIQSPRTGQEIQITSLSEDYWQRHYVGARRVMTPKTLR
ncbi:NlpC/P60 family protein [Escherichia coli]|nr:NlpC/P60 family protein [Escherichia coli]